MGAAVKLRVFDCIAGLGVPQTTERQHIGDQIDAAFIFARAEFVNVLSGRLPAYSVGPAAGLVVVHQ